MLMKRTLWFFRTSDISVGVAQVTGTAVRRIISYVDFGRQGKGKRGVLKDSLGLQAVVIVPDSADLDIGMGSVFGGW